ncbi:MAG: hybrid sensor histidine kinase/response regulator, partial [Phototrophicales bacterium]
ETQPDIMPLDMKIIVDDSTRRLAQLIEETQAEISYPDDFPLAQGYAPWVEEIWANYLSNALKYGGRPAKVTIGADEPQNGMVRFWIRDNGRGLTADEQRRVFTPFTRLNQVKIEGHGLGLSIVQRIVNRLGGDVGVRSVVGEGSEFSFTLPQWDGRI